MLEFADKNLLNRAPAMAPTHSRLSGLSRRNPTAFEYIEQSQPAQESNQDFFERRYSCRKCSITGHISRSSF